MRIGLDLDNTLVRYDAVFLSAGRAAGLLPAGFSGDKDAVRAAIRARPAGGEAEWQRLQGLVYGRLMRQATLFDGAAEFLATARRAGAGVFIVSHKTRRPHAGPDGPDLHDTARAWLDRHGFFAAEGFAVPPGNVFFEVERAAKLARLATLDLDAVVDDLPELLDDPAFPPGPRRFLFTAGRATAETGGRYTALPSWAALTAEVFGVA